LEAEIFTLSEEKDVAWNIISGELGFLSVQAKRLERPPLSSENFEEVLCTIT